MTDMNLLLLMVFVYHMILVYVLLFNSHVKWRLKIILPAIGIIMAFFVNLAVISNRGFPSHKSLPDEFWVLHSNTIEPNTTRGVKGGVYYMIKLDDMKEPLLFGLPYTKDNQKQQIKIDAEQQKSNGAPVKVKKSGKDKSSTGSQDSRSGNDFVRNIESMLNGESDDSDESQLDILGDAKAGPAKH